MMTQTQDLLGIGLYTPSEAAFYARVSTQLITRWLFGYGKHPSIIKHQLDIEEQRLVTFLDLVQAIAIREIRIKYGVSLQKIREAVTQFRETYGIEYPFAREHTSYLFPVEKDFDRSKKPQPPFKGDLYIRKSGDEEDIYEKLTGKGVGQYGIIEAVELYSKDLHFDPEGLANSYYPMKRNDNGKERNVKLDPNWQFGEPFVDSCGITALTLYEASISEGGLKNAAEAYDVEPQEVELACRYIDYLEPKQKIPA